LLGSQREILTSILVAMCFKCNKRAEVAKEWISTVIQDFNRPHNAFHSMVLVTDPTDHSEATARSTEQRLECLETRLEEISKAIQGLQDTMQESFDRRASSPAGPWVRVTPIITDLVVFLTSQRLLTIAFLCLFLVSVYKFTMS
jgi:hypothetical protein